MSLHEPTHREVDWTLFHSEYIHNILISKGKSYEYVHSRMHHEAGISFWKFSSNKWVCNCIFLSAFDKNYENLIHMWLVTNNFMKNKKDIYVGDLFEHTVTNMKKYEITDLFINKAMSLIY